MVGSKTRKPCEALCCSGFSASSSSPFASSYEGIVSSGTEPSQAHGIVRERLTREIHAGRRGKVLILVAMNKSSYEPRRDFRESILEVITSKGLEEPKDLRTLLNCYISMNPREQRQAILEAFHEVCSALFS